MSAQLLTKQDVMARLQMSRSTIQRHMRAGRLKATRPEGGRAVRFTEEALAEFLKADEAAS